MIDVEVDLVGADKAPQAARCALRRLCADQVHPDLLLDAELLIGELAAHALRDGPRRVTVHAHLASDRLVVEVIEQDAGAERHDAGSARAAWEIVDDVASRCGVREGSTHVWFELQR